MIELLFLFAITAILSSWFVFVIVTITIGDFRTIRLEQDLRQHPHARKWRGVTKLSRQLVIRHDDHFVSQQTTRFGLSRFQAQPSTRFVELIPRLDFPQTTHRFFTTYRMIVLAPFVRVRAVVQLRPGHSLWPTLQQEHLVKTRLEKWYGVYVWLLSVTNLALLLYVGAIAVALGQPDYLLAYLTVFGLWLAWSIMNYPQLVARQKIAYLLLAPASFSYFLWRTIIAPFTPPLRALLHPLTRRVLS